MRVGNRCGICMMLIFSVVLTGCITVTHNLPDFLPAKRSEIPGDAQLAAAAILLRLNGIEPAVKADISFEKEAADNLDAPFLKTGTFFLKGQRLFQYAERPEGKPGRILAGQMQLADRFGRRAKLNYIAEYDLADSGFVIHAAEVQPAYATDPAVETFLVPLNTFEKEMANSPATWEGLYLLAKRLNVLPIKDDPKIKENNDYTLLAFSKDRTAPSARAVFRLANRKTSDLDYGYAKDSSYLNFNGWIVATASGTFTAVPEKDFWVKLVLSPGKEAESGRSRIVFHQELGKIALN